MWQATFTISLGFVLTVLIGGAYASYLQRRSWEHQNRSRLDEEARKRATEICTALSESIDKRRSRLWRLLEAIEKRVQNEISADELRDRGSECDEAVSDWNDQLTTRLVSVGVYFGEDLRNQLRDTVDQRFEEVSDGIEKLYRLVAAASGATVGGIDTNGVGSVTASLDKIRDAAYGLSFTMMQRIGRGEIGRNKPQPSPTLRPSEAAMPGPAVVSTDGAAGPGPATATAPIPGQQKASSAWTDTAGEQGPYVAIAGLGLLWVICMSLPLWDWPGGDFSAWQLLAGAGSLPGLQWGWLPALAMLAIAVLATATLVQRWSRYRAVTLCSAIAVGAVSVVTLVALGVEATNSYGSYCNTVDPDYHTRCLSAEGLGFGYYLCITVAALATISGLWAAVQRQRRHIGPAV
ncbi:MAG TPA: hypothetical protein VHX38_26890 [Pseudonocardiaceae bacterium]|nr:hypothetical protein [Pseudonocardiaceae bacterium]